jgi:hypothetical protein
MPACLACLRRIESRFGRVLDVLLLILFARGYGSTHDRVRTTASYVSLSALLLLSQGWAPEVFTPELVTKMRWFDATISLTIVLRRLGILRRTHV